MYFSIYNDKKFDISKLFFHNLINSYHFSNTVRTPPNRYKNYFMGELKGSKKPNIIFHDILKKSQSTSFKHKKALSFNKRLIRNKGADLPKLLLGNRNINNYTYKKKNKCILTNEILNNGNDMGIINLNFPYCKPKLKYSNSNLYINNRNKYRYISTNNVKKENYQKSNRLFMKSLSNFHQIINKSRKRVELLS